MQPKASSLKLIRKQEDTDEIISGMKDGILLQTLHTLKG